MTTYIDKVALVWLQDGKVLMTREDWNDIFYIPWWTKENPESDIQTLHREVSEELWTTTIPGTEKFLIQLEAQAHGKPEWTYVRISHYTAEMSGTPKPWNEIVEIARFQYEDKSRASLINWMLFDWLFQKWLLK